jgi:hypothetical protein
MFNPVPFAPTDTIISSYYRSITARNGAFSGTSDELIDFKSECIQGDTISAINKIFAYLNKARYDEIDGAFLRWAGIIAARRNNDSLLTMVFDICSSRDDLYSKIITAEMEARQKSFRNALRILDSYSFNGSPSLLKNALLRKALWLPRAYHGGYRDALPVLDSLKQLFPSDSMLSFFIKIYPKLYSGLTISDTVKSKKTNERVLQALLPADYDIRQNYPNPSDKITSFTFKIPEASHVNLTVYNSLGIKIQQVTDNDYDPGTHSVVMNTSALSPGMYFYRFTAGDKVVQRKMLVMK